MHRTRTPSFITRFFASSLLSHPSLVVPPRAFRFSSSSSSDLANARPSFPSPSRPPVLLGELGRRVQSLTFHRIRLIAAALTYCAIRCTRSARSPRPPDEKEACGPQNGETLLRTGMLSRENCVYSSTSAAGGIAREKGGKQEMVTAASIASTRGFRFPRL